MPLVYTFRSDIGLLVIVGQGEISQNERLNAIRGWLSDPSYKPGLDVLCDLSGAATATVSSLSELREMVALVRENAQAMGPHKLAVVASKPVGFGVARQFEALMAVANPVVDVRIFATRSEAWSWLRPDIPE